MQKHCTNKNAKGHDIYITMNIQSYILYIYAPFGKLKIFSLGFPYAIRSHCSDLIWQTFNRSDPKDGRAWGKAHLGRSSAHLFRWKNVCACFPSLLPTGVIRLPSQPKGNIRIKDIPQKISIHLHLFASSQNGAHSKNIPDRFMVFVWIFMV